MMAFFSDDRVGLGLSLVEHKTCWIKARVLCIILFISYLLFIATVVSEPLPRATDSALRRRRYFGRGDSLFCAARSHDRPVIGDFISKHKKRHMEAIVTARNSGGGG